MADVRAVVHEIEREIGAGKLLDADSHLGEWCIDEVRPQAVVFPETIKEISFILRAAHEARAAVIPYGQGTKMALGGIPHQADLILSTTRYNRVIDYDVSNFTLTAEAGISLAAVQELVHENKQFFPLDPPFPTGSLGGIVATNASGPKRLAYGSLRDLVLGIKVILPNGERLQYGGKVMKNVAGYDLTKLYIGSLGTLGILGEVTLRLLPLPEQEKTCFLSFADIEKAAGFLAQVRNSYLRPSALELLDPLALEYLGLPKASSPSTVGLLASLEGRAEAVEREVQDTRSLATDWQATQQEVWEGQTQQAVWNAPAHLPGRVEQEYPLGARCKISVPSAAVGMIWQMIKTLNQKRAIALLCFGRGGSGILYVNILGQELEDGGDKSVTLIKELTRLVDEQHGFIILETAPTALKKRLDVWGPPRATVPVMKSLKAKFDPRAILNPGRFVGRI